MLTNDTITFSLFPFAGSTLGRSRPQRGVRMRFSAPEKIEINQVSKELEHLATTVGIGNSVAGCIRQRKKIRPWCCGFNRDSIRSTIITLFQLARLGFLTSQLELTVNCIFFEFCWTAKETLLKLISVYWTCFRRHVRLKVHLAMSYWNCSFSRSEKDS